MFQSAKFPAQLYAALLVGLLMPSLSSAQSAFEFNVYTDVRLDTSSQPDEDWTFSLGAVDFFARTQLNDQVSALAEVMVGVHGDSVMVHPARLYIRYAVNQYLNIRVGRFHTPLGHYMTNYPHGGRVFQLTIDRPEIGSMTMGKEILPPHTTGLTVNGALDFGEALEVKYDFGIGNGGNHMGGDDNYWKALMGRIGIAPLALLEGLEFGGSGYYDRIPKHDAGDKKMDELILVGYLHYNSYPLEFDAEYFSITHTNRDDTTESYDMSGFYVQAGYDLEWATPYVRYEQMSYDGDDPVIAGRMMGGHAGMDMGDGEDHSGMDMGGDDSMEGMEGMEGMDHGTMDMGNTVDVGLLTAGLRFRLHEQCVLKLEYRNNLEKSIHKGIAQLAIGF